MQQAKAILKRNGLTKDDSRFQEIRSMLEEHNNMSLIGTFTKWLFEDVDQRGGTSVDSIRDTYELWLQTKEGINLQQFKTAEDAYDALQIANKNKAARQMIQELPRKVKNIVDRDIINIFQENSDLKDQIIEFLESKSSRYNTKEGFKRDLQSLVKHLREFSMQSIMEKIRKNDLDVEIAGKKGDELLVLKIDNFEASSTLGTSSWCICTSESMFNNYADMFSNQYFVYDFRKDPSDIKSMIGVTVNPDGDFSAAHWRDDSNANDKESKKYIEDLTREIEEA